MSSFYLIVKRGETSLRLGYSAQQVHIIIIIIIITSKHTVCPCQALARLGGGGEGRRGGGGGAELRLHQGCVYHHRQKSYCFSSTFSAITADLG